MSVFWHVLANWRALFYLLCICVSVPVYLSISILLSFNIYFFILIYTSISVIYYIIIYFQLAITVYLKLIYFTVLFPYIHPSVNIHICHFSSVSTNSLTTASPFPTVYLSTCLPVTIYHHTRTPFHVHLSTCLCLSLILPVSLWHTKSDSEAGQASLRFLVPRGEDGQLRRQQEPSECDDQGGGNKDSLTTDHNRRQVSVGSGSAC